MVNNCTATNVFNKKKQTKRSSKKLVCFCFKTILPAMKKYIGNMWLEIVLGIRPAVDRELMEVTPLVSKDWGKGGGIVNTEGEILPPLKSHCFQWG